MYKLIIEDDEGKTTVVPLIRDEISIGRKEGNTIRLTERNVSRKHARLFRQNGAVYIEDLGSYNGIKVNGDRISGRAAIGDGDRIQIGDYQLSIKLDRTESKGAPGSSVGADDRPTTPFVRASEPASSSVPTQQTQAFPSPQSMVPTVPHQALTVPVPSAEKPARLVVISKNFFRQEFPLDKAAVVIGRTDENDVVINHRSISRHHAKIVREGGHYHIVDLQSANGVRVNGEEYGKVELRKGDQIDLGHVRLVFVPPGGECDVAKPVNTEEAGRRSGVAMFLLALVVIGGLGVAARYLVPHLGITLPGGKVDPDLEAAKLLLDVDSDLLGKRWDDAISRAERVLAMSDISAKPRDTASAKKEKAQQERRMQSVYESFATLAGTGKYDEALQIYRELSPESVYHQMAREHYDKIFPIFVSEHMKAAESARVAGNCAEYGQQLQQILSVEPNHLQALTAKARPCSSGQAVAREPRDPPRTPGKGPKKAPYGEEGGSRTQAAAGPVEEGEADRVLQQAQTEYVNGNHEKAIDLARSVSRVARAWRIIGAAACNIRDLKLAGDAYRRLDASSRQYVVYVCQRNGISFNGGLFKLAE